MKFKLNDEKEGGAEKATKVEKGERMCKPYFFPGN